MLYANDKDTAGIIGQRGTPFQFGRELHACHSQSPFGHNLSHIIATIVAQVSASRRRRFHFLTIPHPRSGILGLA